MSEKLRHGAVKMAIPRKLAALKIRSLRGPSKSAPSRRQSLRLPRRQQQHLGAKQQFSFLAAEQPFSCLSARTNYFRLWRCRGFPKISRRRFTLGGRGPMSPFATISATIAALLLLGSAARAEITVCNDFRASIRVALAYQNEGRFTAAGWWSVAPNACQPVEFAFQGSTLYYAADSDAYKDGRFTKRDHWGNKIKLFVNTKNFKSDSADYSRPGAKAEMFSLVEISKPAPGKNPAITFHFTPGNTAISVKTSP